eukprot:SAG25_NODE_295_length_10249_cov_5.144926_13_plen_93_part_00
MHGASTQGEEVANPTFAGNTFEARRPWRPFVAGVWTEIYLCNVCSRQEILRRHGRGQAELGGELTPEEVGDADQSALLCRLLMTRVKNRSSG